MGGLDFEIDPDITLAQAMPAKIYTAPEAFERQRTRVFARTWHLVPQDLPTSPPRATPWELLPGCLDEPVVLVRDAEGGCTGLSNVCTHRAAVLLEQPSSASSIRCPYHGRRFGLDGRLLHAPGFETCPNFPQARDDLRSIPVGTWGPLVFASLDPCEPFDAWLAPLQARVGSLLDLPMRHAPEHLRTFSIAVNWALYCDNYLEGLHIPFVHPSLRRALDLSGYHIEPLPRGVLQRATAAPDEVCFVWPKSHPDHGLRVAAYYYWLFPTTMVNVYPWGLSLNSVLPGGPGRTQVVFLRYVWDDALHDRGAGSGLDAVEQEDEAVIGRCQRGLRSACYPGGRYAPQHERGVHHFHRLLADAMRSAPSPIPEGTTANES